MRELNCTEVHYVSGAGTSDVISSLNTVMETISASLASAAESLSSATSGREISQIFHTVVGLTSLYTRLTFITALLSAYTESTTSETTTTSA
ncbi:hypothetical protein [Erwinia psidii]|uniref:Uncharacterized protein n=1 Tax=Erwinia psidii TaxID=69224 RepID=A0A3N6RWU3_9GAMM|nr:hypothetical protein [Erwinia psidii]MCX8957077.1 hypothetical protein [Erwinia psidii]MCX8961729.1 hypothetical protein [Erwinia psidii]MCX8965323.1 hypothetical protein [Erwinia psidii]RQM37544.1 hypothetical protein EB241_15000 [Erwinia psidii]